MVRRQFKPFAPFQDNQEAQMRDLLTNGAPVTEQDTLPLATFHKSTPPVLHKVEQDTLPLAAVHGAPAVPHKKGTLSMAVQRVINTGLTRLQDPQPEGLFTRGLQAAKPGASLGLLPILALTNALGLLI